jgi:hypothetical protein
MTQEFKAKKSETPSEPNAMAAKLKGRATVTARIRKIRHSPVADPKKVKLVRQIVRELKAKKSLEGSAQAGKSRPEIPFVTAVR